MLSISLSLSPSSKAHSIHTHAIHCILWWLLRYFWLPLNRRSGLACFVDSSRAFQFCVSFIPFIGTHSNWQRILVCCYFGYFTGRWLELSGRLDVSLRVITRYVEYAVARQDLCVQSLALHLNIWMWISHYVDCRLRRHRWAQVASYLCYLFTVRRPQWTLTCCLNIAPLEYMSTSMCLLHDAHQWSVRWCWPVSSLHNHSTTQLVTVSQYCRC